MKDQATDLAPSRLFWLVLCSWSFVLLPGCGDDRPRTSEETAGVCEDASRLYDPATAGTLRGRVTWAGAIPEVRPFMAPVGSGSEAANTGMKLWENPNKPQVDPHTKGVGNAVVFLRGVDPQRARPWDHPPVRVEQASYRFHVHQGPVDTQYGFIRRGERIEMVSTQAAFHSLHASGAAFFTLAFPDPDQPCSRRLGDKGVVELTSAAGYFWMRGYLFVDDHPYYTCTDADGRFTLDQIPPGRYEAVCWVPNWERARHERDPETGLITRLTFCPPVEFVQPVTLEPGAKRDLSFTLSAAAFPE